MLVPQTKVGALSSAPSSSPSSEEGGASSVSETPPRPLDLAAEGRDVGGVEFVAPRREGGGGGVANCVGVDDLPRRKRRRAAGEEYVLSIGLEAFSSGDEGGAVVVRFVKITKLFQIEKERVRK